MTPAHVRARWLTLTVGAACAAVGWLTAGPSGGLSALAGAAAVVAFFWAGLIPLFVADRAGLRAGVGLAVLLLTYTLRLAVVLLALRLLSRADVVDERWLGATVIVCALTWTAVHVGMTIRAGAVPDK